MRTLVPALAVTVCCALATVLPGCRETPAPAPVAPAPGSRPTEARVEKSPFGTTTDLTPVDRFVMTNAKGMVVGVITYGGIITEIRVPDRGGVPGDVVLGFGTLDGYLGAHPYFGALVGRVANRIALARFSLDGREYRLAANDGPNHLHGGLAGFDKRVWTAEPAEATDGVAVKLSYVSPDGEEHYPGTVRASVVYTLTNRNELTLDYTVTADRRTPVNLTSHSYFNLAGEGSGDILGHEMMIAADRFTPTDARLIPTGAIAPVAGTPFDFRTPAPIGSRIDQVPMAPPGGYDTNYVLSGGGQAPALAARVREPKTGRVMEVLTTEPGLQFYSGNFLDGTLTGKSGRPYAKRSGFCLETQRFPDAVHHPGFPSIVLEPGRPYTSRTVYRFSTD